MNIGDRVVVEQYFAYFLVGEICTVIGFSPTGKFALLEMDNAAQYQCKYPKWVVPQHLRKI